MRQSTSDASARVERAPLGSIRLESQSMNGAERRLLDFVAGLILDLAHSHPRIRDLDVALWIARVAVGAKE
jgi:hypothetical protein